MRPNLADIFRCDDQNALIHNHVASHDPPPEAWGRQSQPQSPLGRVSFPLVLTVNRGEVYTHDAHGKLVEQMLDRHEWLPWAYDGRNDTIRVERSITRDLWHGRITVAKKRPAMLLLECAAGGGMNAGGDGVNISCEPTAWGVRFKWDEQYEVHLRFSVKESRRIRIGNDASPLRRAFAGFDDVQVANPKYSWKWSRGGKCWISVEFTGEIGVTFAVGRPGRVRSTGASTATLRRREQKRWEDFFHDLVPPLETDDPVLRDTYFFAWQTLWSNRCSGGSGMTPMPFTSPARLHYGAQWWWDEAFQSAVFRHLRDPGIAYEFLENFRLAQAGDGMIIGCLNPTADPVKQKEKPPAMPMQPPVIGVVLQLLRDKPGWPAAGRLRPLYDMLHRQAEWLDLPHRDTDGDGLIEYHHCDDSGLDQSQRWDERKVHKDHVISALHPTEVVDGNAWASVLWDVLGDMAEQLGDAPAAASHHARARRIMELVDELMWDERDGLYYDIDAQSHRKNKVKSPFAFMVMLSRHARRDRCERMVRDHLTNPRELACRWPLPSCTLDNPTFDPVNMWRGSTWVNANWLITEGLSRQGFMPEAQRLARKTIELVGPRYDARGRRTRSPRLFEWYHPQTGAPLGNAQYSWSALVVDLILRFPPPSLSV